MKKIIVTLKRCKGLFAEYEVVQVRNSLTPQVKSRLKEDSVKKLIEKKGVEVVIK